MSTAVSTRVLAEAQPPPRPSLGWDTDRVGRGFGVPQALVPQLAGGDPLIIEWAVTASGDWRARRAAALPLSASTIAITLGIYSQVSETLHGEAASLVTGLVLSDAT